MFLVGLSTTLVMAGAAGAQPVATNLGTLRFPQLASITQDFAPFQVKWYRFVVPDGVDAAAYLDITTSGTLGDTEIGLYDEFGAVRAIDDDDGPGSYSALTFGRTVPTRVNGDGVPHDGRDGPLPAGLYYLAVAGFNATFSFDWDASTESESSGSVTTTLRLGGSTQPPPVNEACVGAIDLGPGPYPVVSAVNNITGAAVASEVAMCATSNRSVWYRLTPAVSGVLSFSTCATVASLCSVPATVIEVYSSAGGSCLQLAPLGCSADGCGARAVVEQSVNAGATYFVQVAAFGDIPPSTGADVLQVAVTPTCGSADFNNDGDTGTDLDIEAFFACLGGGCCPGCTADFNYDGDTGTDLDIEAFFRVLGGGSC